MNTNRELDTLKDLVARGRDRDGVAIDATRRRTPYSYEEFCTNVWKAGNLLGHYGVHPGARASVAAGPKVADSDGTHIDAADPLLAILGATLLGATVDLSPTSPVDSRALVLPWDWCERYETSPVCSTIAYGGPPDEPDITHFETELWSENPIEPPEPVTPETVAFVADGFETATKEQTRYTHESVLEVSRRLVDRHELDETSQVGLAAPLDTVGTLIAGVLAPLSVGATVLLLEEDEASPADISLVVTVDGDGDNCVSGPAVLDEFGK